MPPKGGIARQNLTEIQLLAAKLRQCPSCNWCFQIRGFTNHYRACSQANSSAYEARKAVKAAPINPVLLQSLNNSATTSSTCPGPSNTAGSSIAIATGIENLLPSDGDIVNNQTEDITFQMVETEDEINTNSQFSPSSDLPSQSAQAAEEGATHALYYDCQQKKFTSGRPPPVLGSDSAPFNEVPVGDKPYWPFKTLEDFEFAEIATSASLSAEHTDAMLKLLHKSMDCNVTFKNNRDLRAAMDRAKTVLTPFEQVDYTIPYPSSTGEDMKLTVWIKPLMGWLLELLDNPELQPHFHFHAQRKFRAERNEWIRFVDEPWTADDWREMQKKLPIDGLPLAIILYSDKSKLSSFGTKKGYPVIARLANLPHDIRNGRGVGGGRVVGWLPVIDENALDSGKTSFANARCAAWHAGMAELLRTIKNEARMGYAMYLTSRHALREEKQLWRLFPSLFLVSADYDEQLIIACIRSSQALAPCVRCLIPLEMLANLAFIAEARTAENVRQLFEKLKTMNITQGDALLKPLGYRPVQNSLLALGSLTDPFRAFSYDVLHTDDLGRWGKHLWPMLQDFFEDLTRNDRVDFEARLDAVPSWPELNHFRNALSLTFGDGRKFEDLLKVVLHRTLNMHKKYAVFIALVRKQAEIQIFASLTVQTSETIALGQAAVEKFQPLSEECTRLYGKSFEFPKMHLLSHLFNDVWTKGVTLNYNTKPSEQMHASLRKAYMGSSKKHSSVDAEADLKMMKGKGTGWGTQPGPPKGGVIAKILERDHWQAVTQAIRSHLESIKDLGDEDLVLPTHISLGSRQGLELVTLLEQWSEGDPAFRSFSTRVTEYLNRIGHHLENSSPLKIKQCELLKVQFESCVNWRSYRNILRCSSSFHGQERRDCVLISREDGVAFAQLLGIFEPQPSSTTLPPFALVLYMDPVLRALSPVEHAMGFCRLRRHSRVKAELVSLESIIRGALVVSTLDPSHPDDFLANDLVDEDMFLRFLYYTRDNIFSDS
ncbi:hypothetical protein BDV93DRAFT_516331 [Ceratobasidium sp. AG-I]|nr:hypothetical protein BDV93DRAFT_516331 [Ceratobasidium sp. AG-I]